MTWKSKQHCCFGVHSFGAGFILRVRACVRALFSGVGRVQVFRVWTLILGRIRGTLKRNPSQALLDRDLLERVDIP